MDKKIIIEPLGTNGLSDYHCHCDYSVDAAGTIDQYCEAAVRRGLAELCFTTHYDTSELGPTDDNVIRVEGKLLPATPKNLKPYVEAVHAAADKYYPYGLAVKLGVEFGWYPGCDKSAESLKGEYDFDHFMCGMHELNGRCFCCRDCYEKCFEGRTVEALIEEYVTQISAAAQSGLFDCIAHLDYIRKYGEHHFGPALNTALDVAMPTVIDALVASGTAIEINSKGMRAGMSEYFPRIKTINGALKAGVQVRFLGSDAHQPEHVGYDFDSMAPLIASSMPTWCED